MRISTFLIGAAAGAAAVMYMNRSNRTALAGFTQLGDNLNKVLDRAMMTMADKGMRTYREPENNQSLNQVEQMVNRDPFVKNEVNQILSENNVTAH